MARAPYGTVSILSNSRRRCCTSAVIVYYRRLVRLKKPNTVDLTGTEITGDAQKNVFVSFHRPHSNLNELQWTTIRAVSDPRRGQRSGGFPPTIHPLSLAAGPLDAVRGRRVPFPHAPCFLSLMRLCALAFLLDPTLLLPSVGRTRRAFICGSLPLTSTCF